MEHDNIEMVMAALLVLRSQGPLLLLSVMQSTVPSLSSSSSGTLQDVIWSTVLAL